MKRHALFFATALAVASIGTAGLAVAQSPSTPAGAAGVDAQREGAKGERPMRHGKGQHGPRGARGPAGMHGGGIERMDADGDGRISRVEFDAAKAAREQAREAGMAVRGQSADAPRGAREGRPGPGPGPGPGMGPGLREAFDFDAIDANRDGYIVRAEVSAHREKLQQQMRVDRAKRFADAFAAADLNKDGKLSRVEVDEKMPHLSSRFAWMDDNRDGFLSRAEIEAGKSR